MCGSYHLKSGKVLSNSSRTRPSPSVALGSAEAHRDLESRRTSGPLVPLP
jgi:hypothetical protein